MRTRHTAWKLLGALLALTLLAAACGGGDDSSDDGSGGSAADIDPDGVLRLPSDLSAAQAGQLDPIIVDVLLYPIHEYLFGTLLKLNAEGEVEPNLAESVDITDSTHLVVKLRPGLKFTDGTVLDAEALKFSWERTIAQAKPGGIEGEFREVKTLTVASATELQVELTKPIAGAFYRLLRFAEASPVSPTAVKSGADFNKSPVGAGPFKLKSYEPNVAIRLEKNPDYWNADEVKLAGIEYVNVSAQAMTNAVRSNTIDFTLLSAAQTGEVKGAPGFEVTTEASNGIMLQGLWCKSRPPFDNLKVRQALNYAVDRESLNAAVYNGLGEDMDGFNSSISPFYDEELDGYYEYDAAKAKKLLAEAGAANLAFDMFFQPSSDGQVAAEVLQQQFDKVGVKVTLKPLSNATDFYPNATGAPINILPLARVGIPKVTRVLVPPSFGNICNWDDPELNEMVLDLQAIEETSPEGIALWKKISEYGLRKAVHLFGLFGTQGVAVDESRLGGVEFYEGRLGQPTLDIEKVFIKK
ncbi:MAG: ABC transporter substrate-binding protein [Acidimicrobiia bacterium]